MLLTLALQIHFPDHTKLVLSPTGLSVSLTTISPEAVSYLQSNSDLLPHHVTSREVFTDTVQSLLHEGGRIRSRIVKANQTAEKLGFVLSVVQQWVRNEGLGCLDEDGLGRLEWEGLGVDAERMGERVSVGRYGGDEVKRVS